MKAVIIKEHGVPILTEIEEQKMRPDYVKVKTVALAVNPTDLHHAAGAGRVGGILGCDLSGIVEEVGEQCKSDVKKGDHVYGVCHGANLVNFFRALLRRVFLSIICLPSPRVRRKTELSPSTPWFVMVTLQKSQSLCLSRRQLLWVSESPLWDRACT
jgi:hypothetical protein